MEESQDFKPDRGNPAVRHYRGASENVTLVELCSHLATERAGMGTLHLTVGASEFYPNRFSARVTSRICFVCCLDARESAMYNRFTISR